MIDWDARRKISGFSAGAAKRFLTRLSVNPSRTNIYVTLCLRDHPNGGVCKRAYAAIRSRLPPHRY